MAHSCPTCGQACYCGGDIDDAFDVDADAEDDCIHCWFADDDDPDEMDEPECCPMCGKAYEEFGDLGCGYCDRRSPEFGALL